MDTYRFGILSISSVLIISCNHKETKTSVSLPNIIIILADDYGVGNIQSHYPDNKIPSPYLDRMVTEGMSFTDAHSSSAVCTPTRYSLLTGRYNWRTPLQEWVLASYEPPLIEPGRVTLPSMLKEHNYTTACIGKWHLGWHWPGERSSVMMEEKHILNSYEWDYSQPLKGGPIEYGFDYYYGDDVINFPPYTYIENDRIINQPTAIYVYDPDEGVVMPETFDGAPKAPDWSFDQVLTDITNRAVEYIHEKSKNDSPFFLFYSMTAPHEPVVPNENFAGKSGIAPIADFVMETDWSAGQVIKAVEDAGIAENTIIIFTADNGHSHYTGWEHLIEAEHFASGEFRGHKGTIWEGGHRVPFIVKWEGRIEPGTTSDQLLCITDFFATFNELVTGYLPEYDTAEDSFSFLNTLFNVNDPSPRTSIVSHSVDGEFSYRNGPWKIVYLLPEKNLELSRGKLAKIELYNLEQDVSETRDISLENPDIVNRLKNELKEIVERGTSREGPVQMNDAVVWYDYIQPKRWVD